MIELGHPKIPVKRQCELLGVPRSSAYYAPVGESSANLALMRLIDELYTLHPFYGVRQITRRLRQLGQAVNFKRVRRLMRLMGLVAQVPKPNLSKPAPGHRIYPYLLRNLEVVRANQVWAMDITYVPIEGGFVYLCAVLDWHSRKVLSWRLSNSMDASFCLEALREALATHGRPEIMNTDQGSQFTSEAFLELLTDHGIRISMDGRGRALDNVFIERLWRTVKY
jgi:putative transposase